MILERELKKLLRREIEGQESDANFEDPVFAQTLADAFEELMNRGRQ
jgi:hypothetical protein